MVTINSEQNILNVVDRKQESLLRVLSIDSTGDWDAALSGIRDFYHLSFYHRIAQSLNQGDPKLFVYYNGDIRICIPLMIRRINHSPISGLGEEVFYDASSVYGYAGPIFSHTSIPEAVRTDFQERLTQKLSEMQIVSVFSRLHPLLNQEFLLEGLGSLAYHGQTVSIDLSISERSQVEGYRGNLRRAINKVIRAGAICIIDEDFQYLDAFIDIYNKTMCRVGATGGYNFPAHYFKNFTETRDTEVKLIVCLMGSEVICAGLFVKCGDILQYHLGGTADAWLKLSPMKFVIDTARHWGYEHGAKILHLGGGVGSREDSLFQFKLGFSKDLHDFKTWRWILLPSVYDRLMMENSGKKRRNIENEDLADFFPQYRFF